MAVQALTATMPRKYQALKHDVGGLIRFADGSRRRFEFTRGSGYLSQSDRTLFIPASATSVIIYDDQGMEHEILAAP